eukprot:2110545-Pyramimonas_sp.AAC.1
MAEFEGHVLPKLNDFAFGFIKFQAVFFAFCLDCVQQFFQGGLAGGSTNCVVCVQNLVLCLPWHPPCLQVLVQGVVSMDVMEEACHNY